MKYVKMIFPNVGKFTNGDYDIVGILWFGRVLGICTRSRWNSVMNVGDLKNLPQYHLKKDDIPQFYKK